MPLDGLLEVTASKEPVPGGGGIAAMTAASAAALVEMVANLTIGKKGYDEIEKLMVSIRDKATPDRAAKVQQAFKDAALSPFEMGKDIFVLLQLAEQVVRYGNAWVITDGVIATMNARAAMRSAFYSVRINLKSIKDETFVTKMINEIREIEEKAAIVEQNVEYEYRKR